MTMPPGLRKAVLTAHVATSVGWLGAVVAYLALDLTASLGNQASQVAASYQAMDVVAGAALIPLAVVSVAVGVVNALGTPWGLIRHYWVLIKLLLTLVATAVLVIQSRTIDALATDSLSVADPRTLPGTLPHSIGGLLVLLIILVLSMYKPRGLTRYRWRKQQAQRRNPSAAGSA